MDCRVDRDGWVRVGGEKIGRYVIKDGKPCLEVKPKDRRAIPAVVSFSDLGALAQGSRPADSGNSSGGEQSTNSTPAVNQSNNTEGQ